MEILFYYIKAESCIVANTMYYFIQESCTTFSYSSHFVASHLFAFHSFISFSAIFLYLSLSLSLSIYLSLSPSLYFPVSTFPAPTFSLLCATQSWIEVSRFAVVGRNFELQRLVHKFVPLWSLRLGKHYIP